MAENAIDDNILNLDDTYLEILKLADVTFPAGASSAQIFEQSKLLDNPAQAGSRINHLRNMGAMTVVGDDIKPRVYKITAMGKQALYAKGDLTGVLDVPSADTPDILTLVAHQVKTQPVEPVAAAPKVKKDKPVKPVAPPVKVEKAASTVMVVDAPVAEVSVAVMKTNEVDLPQEAAPVVVAPRASVQAGIAGPISLPVIPEDDFEFGLSSLGELEVMDASGPRVKFSLKTTRKLFNFLRMYPVLSAYLEDPEHDVKPE